LEPFDFKHLKLFRISDFGLFACLIGLQSFVFRPLL
jgi:hypothetical protein